MEEAIIQYYYNRYSEYPTKVYCPPWETQGPENRLSWHKCSFERGKKRYKVACENESFYHYVAEVTVTETEVIVREAFAEYGSGTADEWYGFVSLTLNKKCIFGDDNKNATSFALSIFANAMSSCIDESMAC